MEERVNKLKTDFNNVMNINTIVKNIFEILQFRIDKLKVYYSDFVKDNNQQMFIFGLDSLRFQSKILDIEYDDMKRLYLAINNRMYCEYFKLYNIIVEYVQKHLKDKKIMESIKVNHFPIYKDLEPFKEYKIEIITDLHDSILVLVSALISYLNMRYNEFNTYRNKNSLGLNIDNFVTSFNYELLIKKEKVNMFLTYIEFFHKLHSKYLKRFSNKVQLMYTHINNDINFEENIQMNKNNVDDNSLEVNVTTNYDNNVESGESTPSTISNNTPTLFKNLNKKDKIDNSIRKISSLLQLTPRNKSDSIVSDEEQLKSVINEHFDTINKSCDDIIQSDNTFIELSVKPESLDKDPNEI